MPLTLKNLSGRLLPLTLEDEAFRAMGPPYGFTVHTGGAVSADTRTGARLVTAVRKPVPASITLLPGEARAGLPLAVKLCAEVRSGLDARPPRLRIVAETPDEPTPGAVIYISPDHDRIKQPV